jgi:LPXTG-motif cell wall-anchored protein
LKRLILLISVTGLFIPCLAGARPGKGDDQRAKHRKISADELTVAGVGLAAVLGAAGFLVLRRRKTA